MNTIKKPYFRNLRAGYFSFVGILFVFFIKTSLVFSQVTVDTLGLSPDSCYLIVKGQFKNDKKHGQWITIKDCQDSTSRTAGLNLYRKGKLKSKRNYESDDSYKEQNISSITGHVKEVRRVRSGTLVYREKRPALFYEKLLCIKIYYPNGTLKMKGKKRGKSDPGHLGSWYIRYFKVGKWKYYTEDGNLEKIVWYKNDESVKVKYKIQVEKSDSTLNNSAEQEQPIKRSYKLIYELEVYELINDSTLSENTINLPVIYQNTDTLSLEDYILEHSWDNPKYCESNISNITSVYYYNSKVDSTGQFSEFNVNSNKYISPIQSWNSTSCTETFRNTLNNAVSPIEILDSQYLNKDVCFRLRVWLKLW